MKKIDICVGTDRERNIRVRLSLIVELDGVEMPPQYHSFVLMPGYDHQAQRATVEAHLANPAGGIPGAPWPKIPDAEWNEVLAIVNTLHTPERIAKRREIDRKNAEAMTAAAVRTK